MKLRIYIVIISVRSRIRRRIACWITTKRRYGIIRVFSFLKVHISLSLLMKGVVRNTFVYNLNLFELKTHHYTNILCTPACFGFEGNFSNLWSNANVQHVECIRFRINRWKCVAQSRKISTVGEKIVPLSKSLKLCCIVCNVKVMTYYVLNNKEDALNDSVLNFKSGFKARENCTRRRWTNYSWSGNGREWRRNEQQWFCRMWFCILLLIRGSLVDVFAPELWEEVGTYKWDFCHCINASLVVGIP